MKSSSFKRTQIEHAAARALLRDLQRVTITVDPVPAGWFTSEEWARKWHLSAARTRRLLHDGFAAKLIERRKFNIQLAKITRPVFHYRKAGQA